MFSINMNKLLAFSKLADAVFALYEFIGEKTAKKLLTYQYETLTRLRLDA